MREDLLPLTEESSTQGGRLPRLGKVRDQMVRKTEASLRMWQRSQWQELWTPQSPTHRVLLRLLKQMTLSYQLVPQSLGSPSGVCLSSSGPRTWTGHRGQQKGLLSFGHDSELCEHVLRL